MATKIEWAQQIKAAGLELPENWAKLSTSRAEAAKDKLLGTKKPTLGKTIGRATGAIVGAVLGLGRAAVEAAGGVRQAVIPVKAPEPVRKAQTKAATMPKDPKWRRRAPRSARGWYPVRKLADDPAPMTRQVRRQNERREQKMPIGVKQGLWHNMMGFGKIGTGKRHRAAVGA